MDETVNGRGFDFGDLALTRTEEGAPFLIRHPRTGLLIYNEKKQPLSITFLGQHSDRFRDIMRGIQLRRAEFRNNALTLNPGNPEPLPQATIDAENTELLAGCTVNWTIETMFGEPFPFSPENAQRLYADRRFFWVRDPALSFIQSDGNFLAEGSTS